MTDIDENDRLIQMQNDEADLSDFFDAIDNEYDSTEMVTLPVGLLRRVAHLLYRKGVDHDPTGVVYQIDDPNASWNNPK